MFVNAVKMALVYLSFDELPKEERPPREIWDQGDKLDDWFKAVEKRREEKYGKDGDSPGEIEDPVQNQASDLLISG